MPNDQIVPSALEMETLLHDLDGHHIKATKGEWMIPGANVFRVIAVDGNGQAVRGIVEAPEEHFYFGAQDLSYRGEQGMEQCAADRRFICWARNALPRIREVIHSLAVGLREKPTAQPIRARITHTHTYAILDLTPAAFNEIKMKLEQAGYEHAFHQDEGRVVVDMHGIAVAEEASGN